MGIRNLSSSQKDSKLMKATGVGDEGGFAPNLKSNEEAVGGFEAVEAADMFG